jgi:hypothetical protein
LANVEPALIGSALGTLADDRLRELTGIGAPALPCSGLVLGLYAPDAIRVDLLLFDEPDAVIPRQGCADAGLRLVPRST